MDEDTWPVSNWYSRSPIYECNSEWVFSFILLQRKVLFCRFSGSHAKNLPNNKMVKCSLPMITCLKVMWGGVCASVIFVVSLPCVFCAPPGMSPPPLGTTRAGSHFLPVQFSAVQCNSVYTMMKLRLVVCSAVVYSSSDSLQNSPSICCSLFCRK